MEAKFSQVKKQSKPVDKKQVTVEVKTQNTPNGEPSQSILSMAAEVNQELDGKAPSSENYVQLGSRPPSSMLLQQKDQMSNGQKSLMS